MSRLVVVLFLLGLTTLCFTAGAQEELNDYDMFDVEWVPGQPLPSTNWAAVGVDTSGIGAAVSAAPADVDTSAAVTAPSFAVGPQDGGAKAPIYRQLPSQTAPAQYLPTVTNKRYIQQPIYQHRVIDQPIEQQRFISQPVLVGRQIYQPIVRKIHDRTVVQPHVIQGTTITPHVIEQPVIQKQYRQQDTYEQGYQEQHGVEPTQTLPTTFASTPSQTAGKQQPAAQFEPSA